MWPYARDEQSFELETRYEEDTTCYLLIWRYPDGTSRTERYQDQGRFQKRLTLLEQQLADKGWHLIGSPRILPSGWAGGTSSLKPS